MPEAQDIDVVIPIPDSSRPSALSSRTDSALTYREGFVKNRYIGRTFIMPGQAMRKKSVRQKLNPIGMEFKARSCCWSTTRSCAARRRARSCRWRATRARARSTSPRRARRCAIPNVYGIDMPNQHELVATGRTEAEIAREIGADLLIYQELDALKRAVRARNPRLADFEASCFDGQLHHRRHHARLPGAARRRRATRRGASPDRDDDRGGTIGSSRSAGASPRSHRGPRITISDTDASEQR